MQREQVLSDGQTFTNTDSTGEISTNTIDFEQNAMADDQISMELILTVISATVTSGLTEGLQVSLRTDDAAALTTARDAAGAGYIDAGTIDLLVTDLVAGKQYSTHCRRDKAKRYAGGWVRAKSTSLVGNVVLDIEIHCCPVNMNEVIQVKRSSI